jgi:hypothetical protein
MNNAQKNSPLSVVAPTADARVTSYYDVLEEEMQTAGLRSQRNNPDERLKNIFQMCEKENAQLILQRDTGVDRLPRSAPAYMHYQPRQNDVSGDRIDDLYARLITDDEPQHNPTYGTPCGAYTAYPVGNGRNCVFDMALQRGELPERHSSGLWCLHLTGQKYVVGVDGVVDVVPMDRKVLRELTEDMVAESNRELTHGVGADDPENVVLILKSRWTSRLNTGEVRDDWSTESKKEWARAEIQKIRPDCSARGRTHLANQLFDDDIRQQHAPDLDEAPDIFKRHFPAHPWPTTGEKEQVASRHIFKDLSWASTPGQTAKLALMHVEEAHLDSDEIKAGCGVEYNLILSAGSSRGRAFSSATALEKQRMRIMEWIRDQYNSRLAYTSGHYRKYPLIKRVVWRRQLKGMPEISYEWNDYSKEFLEVKRIE